MIFSSHYFVRGITAVFMEFCLKTSVSLTIFFCTCVYATYFLSHHHPETFSGRTCLLIHKTEKDCFKKMANRVTPKVAGARRLLSGPGSSPPRCNSKCGRCKPCQPVHVAVPPKTSVSSEYYPEAWWCKCRNKLYKPY